MDHARFWSLIDEAGGRTKHLVRALAKLEPADIIGFDAWLWKYYMAVHREDLWAAVYAIRGGCSDDSFDYFRGWLIGQGEAALLATIRDPESLDALIGDRDPRDEAMLGAARAAYEEVTGKELPDREIALAIPHAWPADRIAPRVKWNAAFYAATYPALYEKYFAHLPPAPTGSIELARFWEIIDSARANTPDAPTAVKQLAAKLSALSQVELLGFDRWLSAYNRALMRDDLAIAARLLLGQEDRDSIAGFRGWLILQGEAAVHTAVHDLDALEPPQPPAACMNVIFVTWRPLEAHDIYSHSVDEDELPSIPDRATWSADWPVARPTVAELRARFPRLTADRTDEQLAGPHDPSRMTASDRQRVAADLVEKTKSTAENAAKLEQLDQAVRMWPAVETLAARGRTHARLGNHPAAIADYDAALARSPAAVLVQWDRSRSRLATGDRAGALADARAVASSVDQARAWLTTQAAGAPKRVRHGKFGEGTVVSVDSTGSEPKLVIDFASGRKTIASRFVEAIE